MYAFLPLLHDMYNAGSLPVPSELQGSYELLFSMPRNMFGCMAVLNAVSLAGAILMWRLNKLGFHLYCASQLLMLAVQPVYMGVQYFNLGDAMITLAFIVFYFFSLRAILSLQQLEVSTETPTTPAGEEADDADDDDEDDE